MSEAFENGRNAVRRRQEGGLACGRVRPLAAFLRIGLATAALGLVPFSPIGPASAQRYYEAAGQPPPGLETPLSLEGAVAWALDHNLAIRAGGARVEERVGEARHAGRLVPSNPELEVEGGPRSGSTRRSTDIGISLAQELWIAGQGGLRRHAAAARVASARGELAFLRATVAARVRRAFLDVVIAQESVRTAERVAGLAREVQGYAEARLRAGKATRLEVNSATVALGQAQAALAEAEREEDAARLDLMQLLALDPSTGLPIRGRLAPVRLDVPDLHDLLELALRRRQDLAAAAQEVLAARRELRLSRRLLIPNLTVFGFYQQEEGTDQIGGLGFSLPLPALHRFGGERQAAAARLARARLDRQALDLAVRTEVLRAIADYRSARERARALTDHMLASAEENVRLIEKALHAGKVGAPALTAAQDRLARVRQDYLAAQRDLARAGSDLERATGGLVAMGQGTP